jgi:hypothetical protein
VDEQELPAGAEAPGPSAPGPTPPDPEPAIPRPERRGEGARRALTSRGAGWVTAAILAGAVVALSVVLATGSATTVLQPAGAPRFRIVTAGGGGGIVALPPNGPLRVSWVQVPANARPGSVTIVGPANARPGAVRVEVPVAALPAAGRIQVPAGRWVEVPARVWVQVPAGVVAPAPTASPAKSTAH